MPRTTMLRYPLSKSRYRTAKVETQHTWDKEGQGRVMACERRPSGASGLQRYKGVPCTIEGVPVGLAPLAPPFLLKALLQQHTHVLSIDRKMDDDNVSPEALLTGHRKLRAPVQVVPFPRRKPGGQAEGRQRRLAGASKRRWSVANALPSTSATQTSEPPIAVNEAGAWTCVRPIPYASGHTRRAVFLS